MTWSTVAAKKPVSKPTVPIDIVVQEKEVKNDYWNDTKYGFKFKTVEQQIVETFRKDGFEPPQKVYGRP